jgi:hypothetical protein
MRLKAEKTMQLNVATPWSQTNFFPLNGFHPLYRALFDFAPKEIDLNAWDNVKLQNALQADEGLRAKLVSLVRQEDARTSTEGGGIKRQYDQFFDPSNRILTRLLPGDIEFLHTAPFASLTRPFVFHCEAFSPIFMPFAQQGGGEFQNHTELKQLYGAIFANPLCLGIFSHVPETLRSFETFFDDPEITRKLKASRIGLSEKAFANLPQTRELNLTAPRFLFINSAHQNPENFFRRGGHIALRFWKNYVRDGRRGQLVLRCSRPSDAILRQYGVDPDFVADEMGKSILWAQGYLANHEINALTEHSDFFLLPSASLHSASILQAMNAGAIPVVTDAVGTSVYVKDSENGIVLSGMRDAIWSHDSVTGILVDNYAKITPAADDALVQQLSSRIIELLGNPDAALTLRNRMLEKARRDFSGQDFARQFWSDVQALCAASSPPKNINQIPAPEIVDCLLTGESWARVFESVPQPVHRVYTGDGVILEVGGVFHHVQGNPTLQLADFCVLKRHLNSAFPRMKLDYGLDTLVENLLRQDLERPEIKRSRMRSWVSKKLAPYPGVHSFVNSKRTQTSRTLRAMIRFSRRAFNYCKFRCGFLDQSQDVELIFQDVDGLIVIRHHHLYLAAPRSVGEAEIDIMKIHESCGKLVSFSLEGVLRKMPRSRKKAGSRSRDRFFSR